MIEISTRSLVVQSIYYVYTIYLINITQIIHNTRNNTRKLKSFTYDLNLRVTTQYKLT